MKSYMLRISALSLAIAAGLAVTTFCGPKGETARHDPAEVTVKAS